MKLPALPLVLLVAAGCSTEAANSATKAASDAAAAASNKVLEQINSLLAGVTNAEQAKAAAGPLEKLAAELRTTLAKVTDAWPTTLTATADAVREQIERLKAMDEVKAAVGPVLDQVAMLLPKK